MKLVKLINECMLELNESAENDLFMNNEAKHIYKKILNNLNNINFKPTDKDDYMVTTKISKYPVYGIKFNLSELDNKYNLSILLLHAVGSNLANYNSKTNSLSFFILSQQENKLDFENNMRLAKSRFKSWIDENIFVHEFIHYLDNERYKNNYNFINPKTDEEYYNSPEEFNAFYHEIINNMLKNKKNYYTLAPNKFILKIKKDLSVNNFYNKLRNSNKEKLVKRLYKFYESLIPPKPLTEEDYRGEHSAPVPDITNAPLYDLTKNFPEDLYSKDAVRIYGNNDPNDGFTMNIIQSARNRPNKQITIYRAVPKIITNTEKLKSYRDQQAYIMRYGKLPRGVDNWKDRSEYYEWLTNEIEELSSTPDDERVKINNGDWVTINPAYAKHHGRSNLRNNFRIIRKTVSAKNLWWEGGDINEWGYYI